MLPYPDPGGQDRHAAGRPPLAERGSPPATLEARGVWKRYPSGSVGLAGVDLVVAHGESVALVGESGCGKTTLLRLFNRMIEPTRGEVRVGGRAVREGDPIALRRRLGYVPQHGGLLPHWTVRRNVELVPALLGWNRDLRRRRADEMLTLVGLAPATFGGRHPRELSGGQRQRVAMARALAADPEVVLLDEPLGALDALTRLDLQEELAALKEGLAKTLLLVTHDLTEAFRLGDRVAVMRRGRILQIGPPDELLARPAEEYVARLLAHHHPRREAR